MKPLPDLSPLYLRTTTPEVTHPWSEHFDCIHGAGMRGFCERHRFKLGYGCDRTNRSAPCSCPCHEVKP